MLDSLWLTLVLVTFWPLAENKPYSVPGLQWRHLPVSRDVMDKPTLNLTISHGVMKQAKESGGNGVKHHVVDVMNTLMITGQKQKWLETQCAWSSANSSEMWFYGIEHEYLSNTQVPSFGVKKCYRSFFLKMEKLVSSCFGQHSGVRWEEGFIDYLVRIWFCMLISHYIIIRKKTKSC